MKAAKKILTFVMVASMMLTMLPQMARSEGSVCMIGTEPYDTLGEALSVALNTPDVSETTIKLLQDIEYGSRINVSGKSITFDLNGHKLNITNATGTALEVHAGGVVDIVDTIEGSALNLMSPSSGNGVLADGGGRATVTSAQAIATAVCAVGSLSRIEVKGNVHSTGTFGLNYGAFASGGATVIVDGNAQGYVAGAYAKDGGSVEVYGNAGGACGAYALGEGSSIWVGQNAIGTANFGAHAQSGGKVNVEGDVGGNSAGVYATGSGSAVNVCGNVLAVDGYGVEARDGGSVEVKADVTSGANYAAGVFTTGEGSTVEIEGDVTVTGRNAIGVASYEGGTTTIEGMLSVLQGTYIMLKDEAKTPGDGTEGEEDDAGYLVYSDDLGNTVRIKIGPVCMIGTEPYDTLGEALSVALNTPDVSETTIKLLKDISYSSGIFVVDKTVVFDLNGCKLNLDSSQDDTYIHGLEVGANGVVDITDTSAAGNGEFNITNSPRDGYGVNAHHGGQASVSSVSKIGSYAAVIASGTNGDQPSQIEVKGDVGSSSSVGVKATNGGKVVVGGDLIGTGASAYDSGSIVEISGSVTGKSIGVEVYKGGAILVEEDVAVTGEGSMGVIMSSGGTTIGGMVKIDGVISVPTGGTYIWMDGAFLAHGAGEPATGDYEGYMVYTNGTNYAYVKIVSKNLVRVRPPDAIDDLPNGTEKTAEALGLPATVALETDDGDENATVTWEVDACAYDPALATAQTFTVNGALTLPVGVANPDDVSLEVSISVTVNAADPENHTITASAGSGGSISPSGPVTVAAEETQTFTITPQSNYRILSVEVDGKHVGSVREYTFEEVSGNHTIHATFAYVDDSSDYISRTLTDDATGVTVSGSALHKNAALTVRSTALHAAGTCAACDAIREAKASGKLILGYDIRLDSGFIGTVTVSIPVGSRYNGETVTLLHCANGMLETLSATVAGGRASFTLSSLSPMAVVRGLFTPHSAIPQPPRTGDAATPAGFIMLSFAAVCAIYISMKRRRA